MPTETLVALVTVFALVGVLLVAAVVLARGRRQGLVGRRGASAEGGDGRAPARGLPDVAGAAESAGIGLLLVDSEHTIIGANLTAHRYLGRADGGLPGLSVIGAFLDHRIEDLLLEADQRGVGEMDLVIADEPPRTLLVRALGARDDGSRWLVVQDISELRRLQRIRTEFVDNLSHELRTPLTTIRVLSEVLAAEAARVDLPPRVGDAIAKIEVESEHLSQMVSELLDLARIEQGERPMRRERVSLAEVAGSVVDRLRPYAERNGVVLTAATQSAGEAEVTGDPERLEQLLLNLVQNAVKFSPDGGEVTVGLRAEGTDGVVVEVADHGVGIPASELERIFERFYKVDRARGRASGGTGLGLAIARHIAEAHGGRIWAESEEGKGSRFFVRLPRG